MRRRSSGSGLNPNLEIMNWDAFLIFVPNSGIEFELQLNDLGLGFGLLAPLVART